MIKIKNADEKKIILGYLTSQSRRRGGKYTTFVNNNVYYRWIQYWPDDFKVSVNGKCLCMYNNQFVLSKKSYRRGDKPPAYYDEYTDFISGITEWLNKNYIFRDPQKCDNKFRMLIKKHRKECLDKLNQMLKEADLDKDGYGVEMCGSFVNNSFNKICAYRLLHMDGDNKDIVFASDFETIANKINELARRDS